MKHHFFRFVIVLVVLAGTLLAFYPYLWGGYEDSLIDEDAKEFVENQIQESDLGEKGESGTQKEKDGEKSSNLKEIQQKQDLLDFMEYYNKMLYEDGQKDMVDPYSFTEKVVDLSDYGITDGCIGTVHVPAMDIELPIYVGATYDNLLKGAAYVSQTSFPIGGKNTNSVISAHRGYNGSRYFRDIEDVQVGDTVYVNNLWQTLIYQVTDIKLVDPNAIDEIKIQDGKDMVTLMTCHPYIGHKYRYLIFCERTGELPYEEISEQYKKETENIQKREETEIINKTSEKFESSDEQILWDQYAPFFAFGLLFILHLLIKVIQIVRWKISRK